MRVKVQGRAKRKLEQLAKSEDPAWLDAWSELVAFQRGDTQAAVPAGETGHHWVVCSDGRAIALGINRRDVECIKVEEIDVV